MTGFKTQDTEIGKGSPATCGQFVQLSYESFTEEGELLPDNTTFKEPTLVGIGRGESIRAIEYGVMGMAEGGKRRIWADSSMGYATIEQPPEDVPTDQPVIFDVWVHSITPNLPNADETSFRIFTRKQGSGLHIKCGQQVSASLTVWDIAGNKIFPTDEKSETVELTVGASRMFKGLELGIVDGTIGSHYTLIVPSRFPNHHA